MSEAEVVWEGVWECVVAQRIKLPSNEEVTAIGSLVGCAETALRFWHPEDSEFTALMGDDAMNALAIWWLKRNRHLISQVLTDEQREDITGYVYYNESCAKGYKEGSEAHTTYTRRAKALKSLLGRED